MHIHILGICGTFMAGIATLAKQQGHHVTGSDSNVYPPMSTQLQAQGIELKEGYHPEHLKPRPDITLVGNAMKRGNPAIEYLLDEKLPYASAPQWLANNLLCDRHVLAVAGTHGKTTTTSMLTWILEHARVNPGFLIGGIPQNFNISARLGAAPFFVIEADEYDTAFFDKRSKFIHYQPHTLILNNLEYDHADIFPDLAAIKMQFHHLIRTVPGNGLLIAPKADHNLQDVIHMGCWTPVTYIGDDGAWQARDITPDGSAFTVFHNKEKQGTVNWTLLGHHNVQNALAAIAAAQHAGIAPAQAIAALHEFRNVKRRLELRGEIAGIKIYDDFAHHPTAIATTLNGLRQHVGNARILAVLELGSYTMRTGVHKNSIPAALIAADDVIFARPDDDWGIDAIAAQITAPHQVCNDVDAIIQAIVNNAKSGDHILIMSNTGFASIHEKLLVALQHHFSTSV